MTCLELACRRGRRKQGSSQLPSILDRRAFSLAIYFHIQQTSSIHDALAMSLRETAQGTGGFQRPQNIARSLPHRRCSERMEGRNDEGINISVRQGKLSRQEPANSLSQAHPWKPPSRAPPATCLPFSLRPHSRTGEHTHVSNKTRRTSFIHQPLLNKVFLNRQARLCHRQTCHTPCWLHLSKT